MLFLSWYQFREHLNRMPNTVPFLLYNILTTNLIWAYPISRQNLLRFLWDPYFFLTKSRIFLPSAYAALSGFFVHQHFLLFSHEFLQSCSHSTPVFICDRTHKSVMIICSLFTLGTDNVKQFVQGCLARTLL